MSFVSVYHPIPFLIQPIIYRKKFFPRIPYNNASEIKASAAEEIRVCTNRTCRRQGSIETLQILSGIAPPNVAVNSCGCLGRCGAGPNAVVLPGGVFVRHCGTPSKAANLMISILGGFDGNEDDKSKNCLESLALRTRAEDRMANGDFDEALVLLSQAIDLKPFGGLHIIYRSRSAAKLAVGNITGALEDAKEALAIAPKYPKAYICQGDALMSIGKLDAAKKSYSIALELDPSLRRSKSFKERIGFWQNPSPTDPH